MTEQQWIIWEPTQYLENRYNVDKINFNIKGLSICLSEENQENKTAEILFKNSIIAYTRTDESFVLDLPGNLRQIYEPLRSSGWIFFKVINSRYIERLAGRLNNKTTDHPNWIHFVLITRNEMVDIVSNYEPEVTIKIWDIKTLMLLYKEQILPIIIRYFPTAKIMLYGPRSQAKIFLKNRDTIPIQIALDAGYKIDSKIIEQLNDALGYEAATNILAVVVDFHAVPEELQQQIVKEGIDWAKEKNI